MIQAQENNIDNKMKRIAESWANLSVLCLWVQPLHSLFSIVTDYFTNIKII